MSTEPQHRDACIAVEIGAVRDDRRCGSRCRCSSRPSRIDPVATHVPSALPASNGQGPACKWCPEMVPDCPPPCLIFLSAEACSVHSQNGCRSGEGSASVRHQAPGILDLPSRLSSPLPGVCWVHTRKLPVRRVPLPTRCCRTGRNLPISHPIAFPSSRTVPWDHPGSISSINKAKMPNQKTVDAVELSQTWGGCAWCRAGGSRTSSEGISWHHAGVDLA